MSRKHHKIREPPRVDWVSPEILKPVLALLAQGLTYAAIGKLVRLSPRVIENIRRDHGADIDRTVISPGWPGTGAYAICKICGKRVRMPCTPCAIRAMRKPTEDDHETT